MFLCIPVIELMHVLFITTIFNPSFVHVHRPENAIVMEKIFNENLIKFYTILTYKYIDICIHRQTHAHTYIQPDDGTIPIFAWIVVHLPVNYSALVQMNHDNGMSQMEEKLWMPYVIIENIIKIDIHTYIYVKIKISNVVSLGGVWGIIIIRKSLIRNDVAC